MRNVKAIAITVAAGLITAGAWRYGPSDSDHAASVSALPNRDETRDTGSASGKPIQGDSLRYRHTDTSARTAVARAPGGDGHLTSARATNTQIVGSALDSRQSLGSAQAAENSIRSTVSLTSDDIVQIIAAIPACQLKDNKNRCQGTLSFAQKVISEPKSMNDSWAHGAESELTRLLAQQVAADPKLRNRSSQSQVTCNAHGCLIFRRGPINLAINYAYEIAKRFRQDPAIHALNDRGRWPREYVFQQGAFEEQDFELIEFHR